MLFCDNIERQQLNVLVLAQHFTAYYKFLCVLCDILIKSVSAIGVFNDNFRLEVLFNSFKI